MQGVVYKELRQNCLYFLGGLLLPVIGIIITLLMIAGGHVSNMPTAEIFMFRFSAQLVGYMTLWLFSSTVFSDDESKKWSRFIASAPRGRERHIYGKYVFLFMTCGINFVSSVFCDSFLAWLLFAAMGREDAPNFMGIYLFMLFFQIFVFAFEMPFSARFGTKVGTWLRVVVFMLIALIFIVWLLFSPTAAGAYDRLSDWLISLTEEEISGGLTFFMAAFPFAAMAAFLVSYRISSGCWLKGVQNYEK